MIFVGGLHRSGTSVLNRVLRDSGGVGGLTATGVAEDEGQHLQSVFPPAYSFGGPGRFAFDPRSRMTEASVRDAAAERDTLLREWGPYGDFSRRYFVEKSPPNLVRSRYFEALFPGARFIFIVRHPVAVALATEKWAKTTHLELLLHWDVAHALMLADLRHLRHALVVRYEDITGDFGAYAKRIAAFLKLDVIESAETMSDQNRRYLERWETSEHVDASVLSSVLLRSDGPMARLGYRLEAPYLCEPSASVVLV